MYLKQPIPLVIFRQGHILFNNSFYSPVSNQLSTPSLADTALVREIILPINQAAMNAAMMHRELFKADIVGFLYKTRMQRRIEKGDKEIINPEPYIRARNYIISELKSGIEEKVSSSAIAMSRGGIIEESTSIETITETKRKQVPGELYVEGVNDIDYMLTSSKSRLPTGAGSEWCRAADPDAQEKLLAALLSTEGLDDLSDVLVRTGVIKTPLWRKYGDFVKQNFLSNYFDALYAELLREASALINDYAVELKLAKGAK